MVERVCFLDYVYFDHQYYSLGHLSSFQSTEVRLYEDMMKFWPISRPVGYVFWYDILRRYFGMKIYYDFQLRRKKNLFWTNKTYVFTSKNIVISFQNKVPKYHTKGHEQVYCALFQVGSIHSLWVYGDPFPPGPFWTAFSLTSGQNAGGKTTSGARRPQVVPGNVTFAKSSVSNVDRSLNIQWLFSEKNEQYRMGK